MGLWGIVPFFKNSMLSLSWSRNVHDKVSESFSSILKFIENLLF